MESSRTGGSVSRPFSANLDSSTRDLGVRGMYHDIESIASPEWQTMNYKVPRQYFGSGATKSNGLLKDVNKTSYLDVVEELGRKIPGVGHYTLDTRHRNTHSRGQASSPKYKTLFVQIYENGKRCPTPGPASYFAQSKPKDNGAKRRNKSAFTRDSYLNEVQFLSITSPGVGQYNLSTNILKPSFGNTRSTSKLGKVPRSAHPKMSQINPVLDGTFQKISRTYGKQPKNSLKKSNFNRDRRFRVDKQQASNPAPNKYNYQQCSVSTMAHQRSVYY